MKKETRNTLIILGAALVVIIGLTTLMSVLSNKAAQLPEAAPNVEDVRVSLSDAKVAFDAGEALIVDVRSEEEFTKSRIPGSILIPVDDTAGNEPEVEKDALIFTYCT